MGPHFLVRPEETTLSIHVGEKRLALLGYDETGRICAHVVSPGMEDALNLWLSGGISEWVGPETARELEVTSPEDPLFLYMLASYIRRKIGFYTELKIAVT